MSVAPPSTESFRTFRFRRSRSRSEAPEEMLTSISTSGDTVSLQSARPIGKLVPTFRSACSYCFAVFVGVRDFAGVRKVGDLKMTSELLVSHLTVRGRRGRGGYLKSAVNSPLPDWAAGVCEDNLQNASHEPPRFRLKRLYVPQRFNVGKACSG